jgi:hypothetical protein
MNKKSLLKIVETTKQQGQLADLVKVEGNASAPFYRHGTYLLTSTDGVCNTYDHVAVKLNDGRKFLGVFLKESCHQIYLRRFNNESTLETFGDNVVSEMAKIVAVVHP